MRENLLLGKPGATDEELLLEIYLAAKRNDALLEKSAAQFFKSLKTELPELAGVAAFFHGPAAQSFGYEGSDSLQYETKIATFRVSAGSFFQVNRFLIDDFAQHCRKLLVLLHRFLINFVLGFGFAVGSLAATK